MVHTAEPITSPSSIAFFFPDRLLTDQVIIHEKGYTYNSNFVHR
jgi:hypothetical protein